MSRRSSKAFMRMNSEFPRWTDPDPSSDERKRWWSDPVAVTAVLGVVLGVASFVLSYLGFEREKQTPPEVIIVESVEPPRGDRQLASSVAYEPVIRVENSGDRPATNCEVKVGYTIDQPPPIKPSLGVRGLDDTPGVLDDSNLRGALGELSTVSSVDEAVIRLVARLDANEEVVMSLSGRFNPDQLLSFNSAVSCDDSVGDATQWAAAPDYKPPSTRVAPRCRQNSSPGDAVERTIATGRTEMTDLPVTAELEETAAVRLELVRDRACEVDGGDIALDLADCPMGAFGRADFPSSVAFAAEGVGSLHCVFGDGWDSVYLGAYLGPPILGEGLPSAQPRSEPSPLGTGLVRTWCTSDLGAPEDTCATAWSNNVVSVQVVGGASSVAGDAGWLTTNLGRLLAHVGTFDLGAMDIAADPEYRNDESE